MERLQRFSYLSIIFIGVVVAFAVFKAMATITAPMVLALVAGLVLSPFSNLWERMGFSAASGALVSLLLTICMMAVMVLLFQPLIAQLVEQAPKVWADMQELISAAKALLKGASDAAKEVSTAITEPAAQAAPATAPAAAPAAAEGMPMVTDALWLAPEIAAQIMTFAGVLFFFLMTRADIYSWAARQFAEPMERGPVIKRLFEAERRVSRYFVTISIINACLGLIVGLGLQVAGLPGAMLWGFMTFILNYIVYLGPTVIAAGLIFAGVAAFDGGMAFVPVAIFGVTAFFEGQFITPAMVGKSMEMNPLLVFLSLLFGIWLWGPIGGVVAMQRRNRVQTISSGSTAEVQPNASAAAMS